MIGTDQTVPFPTGTTPKTWRVADWVELVALSSSSAFKRGDLKSAISREDVENEDQLEEAVWGVLARRADLMGPRWPLELSAGKLVRRKRPPNIQLYRFLALLGMGEVIDNTDRRRFEEITAHIIKGTFGRNVLRVGHPASKNQSSSFDKRVNVYRSRARLHELEKGQPLLSTDNDLGLDIVGWAPFADRRGADLHYWVQCSTGMDWDEKLSDLTMSKWNPHLSLAVPPLRVFATPLVLSVSATKWIRISQVAGVVIDRPRLLELAAKARIPRAELQELTARYNTLTAA